MSPKAAAINDGKLTIVQESSCVVLRVNRLRVLSALELLLAMQLRY